MDGSQGGLLDKLVVSLRVCGLMLVLQAMQVPFCLHGWKDGNWMDQLQSFLLVNVPCS